MPLSYYQGKWHMFILAPFRSSLQKISYCAQHSTWTLADEQIPTQWLHWLSILPLLIALSFTRWYPQGSHLLSDPSICAFTTLSALLDIQVPPELYLSFLMLTGEIVIFQSSSTPPFILVLSVALVIQHPILFLISLNSQVLLTTRSLKDPHSNS